METVKRKVTYRLYPSRRQQNQMLETLRLQQKLYNAALEQRIDAYRRCGVSLNYNDQAHDLTQLRAEFPEYAALNAQSEQVTLKRLERAFKAFFQRVKEGKEKPGFPRFKSFDRYKGWGYAAHGDGWKFLPNEDFVNGTIRMSGIGNIQARGRSRFLDEERTSRNPGKPKTMEIFRKNDKWYASVTFETLRPFRASGDTALGIDWGTAKFLTIVDETKVPLIVENPRHLKSREDKLKKAQKSLSRKKKGSSNRKKAKKSLANAHERVAWKREDFLHQTSAAIVKSASLIATEALNIRGMTASGGAYKTGLNRSILDTSPGKFFELLEYKALDAGIPYIEVPTRKVKPSQTCSGCGHAEKKQLSDRVHDCKKCGLVLDRDVNTAIVILNFAMTGFVTGREPALSVESKVTCSLKHETPPIPEHAR
jgi:putative transposase